MTGRLIFRFDADYNLNKLLSIIRDGCIIRITHRSVGRGLSIYLFWFFNIQTETLSASVINELIANLQFHDFAHSRQSIDTNLISCKIENIRTSRKVPSLQGKSYEINIA